jgi:hypothetical protein
MSWFDNAGTHPKAAVFELKLGTQAICQRAHELEA